MCLSCFPHPEHTIQETQIHEQRERCTNHLRCIIHSHVAPHHLGKAAVVKQLSSRYLASGIKQQQKNNISGTVQFFLLSILSLNIVPIFL